MPEPIILTTIKELEELPAESVILCKVDFDDFTREYVYLKAHGGFWLSGSRGRLESSDFMYYHAAHESISLIHRGQEPTDAEIDAWNAI